MEGYNHKEIEKKWQDIWEKEETYKVLDEKDRSKNFYALSEFPYPSGNLHVGHWYAFSVPDIYARKKRMDGYNVLYPIGFDAFGLPAENAAIKHKLNPKTWTYGNMDTMRLQLKSMGASFDWNREIATCDPEYFKWTQWIFTKMFEKKLAYKKKAIVNWDPVDKTVLANEQVLPDGRAERSGAIVEKKEVEQWFLKITEYADRLLNDLDDLAWPDQIKEMQRNWIGKSEGREIEFEIKGSEKVLVFTTRPDTLHGVTYLVLAPEYEGIKKLIAEASNKKEIMEYINTAKKTSDIERSSETREKTGIKIEGLVAINPVNKKEVPVYVADYVIGGYGTGAVMAVPAHDERDEAFAKKYDLPVIEVTEAQQEETKEFGEKKVNYRLRDWSVGRQRYWGTPVPIVYDPKGKPHVVPEEHLPWLLPEDVDPTPTGEAPLAKSKEFIERTEKIFGKGWTPEVETLDTFVDSSWYFLRYLDPKNKTSLASEDKVNHWMPVDYYFGGSEHTTLHLLYSRFFQKVLFDMGLVAEGEPYRKRLNRGLILGPDGNKMSKSKGNVINPDELVETFGADTVRTYLAFIGPYNEAGSYPWDPGSIVGVRRFYEKIFNFKDKVSEEVQMSEEFLKLFHFSLKRIGEEMEELKLNTVVSKLMIISNSLQKQEKISKDIFEMYLKVLGTFAPHLAEEIWHVLGNDGSIHKEKWPKYDEFFASTTSATIGVQINGRARFSIDIEESDTEESVKQKISSHELAKKWGVDDSKKYKMFKYVPMRAVAIAVDLT